LEIPKKVKFCKHGFFGKVLINTKGKWAFFGIFDKTPCRIKTKRRFLGHFGGFNGKFAKRAKKGLPGDPPGKCIFGKRMASGTGFLERRGRGGAKGLFWGFFGCFGDFRRFCGFFGGFF